MRSKKNLIVLPSLWSDDMDIEIIEVFHNSHLRGTDNKSRSFDQLRHWELTDVNRKLLIDFFLLATKLPIENLLGDFKIELILSL